MFSVLFKRNKIIGDKGIVSLNSWKQKRKSDEDIPS
jgi:hypothetical protein